MASDKPIEGKCGAKLRGSDNKGKYCAKDPMTNGRCRLHGGPTPRGVQSVNFKHGRFSRYFKGEMREKYAESKSDERLLDLTEIVAVIDAATKRAAERVSELDTPEFRKQAKALYKEAKAAHADGDTELFAEHFKELGKHLQRGALEDSALAALVEFATKGGNQIEKKWNLALKQERAMSRTDVMTYTNGILAAVAAKVDAKTMTQITESISKMIGVPVAQLPTTFVRDVEDENS